MSLTRTKNGGFIHWFSQLIMNSTRTKNGGFPSFSQPKNASPARVGIRHNFVGHPELHQIKLHCSNGLFNVPKTTDCIRGSICYRQCPSKCMKLNVASKPWDGMNNFQNCGRGSTSLSTGLSHKRVLCPFLMPAL
jgi:hypothetical protein